MSKENQDNTTHRTSVDKWKSLFPLLNITHIYADTDLDLINLTSGIISINAQWSAPSYIHITKILDTLNNCQTKEKIYIVDIDSVSVEFIKNILGQISHGAGETVHISSGQIQYKFTFKQTFQPFIDYLKTNLNHNG